MLERYYYSPYGELEAVVGAHPFDYVLDTTPTAARFDRFAIGELCSRRRVKDDGAVDEYDLVLDTRLRPCRGCFAPITAKRWPRFKENDYDGAGGACKRLDANADREIDADDYIAIAAYVNSLPADGDLQRTPSSPRSLRGNPFGHQGLPLDAEIGSYQNRARQYAATAKRFMQRDPLALNAPLTVSEGANLYFAFKSNPVSYLDPMGEASCSVVPFSGQTSGVTGVSTSCRVEPHGPSDIANFRNQIRDMVAASACIPSPDCLIGCKITQIRPGNNPTPNVTISGTGCPPGQTKLVGQWVVEVLGCDCKCP